jgi:octaprenyl-diphosphate synthase
MSLARIISPVKTELRQFETHYREALKSHVGLVDAIVRYVARRRGKRIRPALVLLSASACGSIRESTYRGAALVELLHTATLIHDDVVDDSATRRGFASINAVWKNKVAVLMGDYVLARGLLLALQNGDEQLLQSASEAVRRMSEGELLQIQKSRQLNIDEETYFRIIGDKTASLLAACCEIGAKSTTGDAALIARMRSFGEHLGIAFQIRDDILDYLGKESLIGKPVGGDLKEKKMTLPLIYSFTKAPAGVNRSILRLLKKGVTKDGINRIIIFVKEYGGIEYANKKAEEYRNRAFEDLAVLEPSASRQALREFTDFVVTRSK